MKCKHMGALALTFAGLVAGCTHTRGPEERTDDGLVRVPSRAAGGVYRAPGALFTQYRRMILEPPTVDFTASWRAAHPEVSDADVARLRDEAAKLFREEFRRQLIDTGRYTLAEAPDADVLIITPRVIDLDIPAPEAGMEVGKRSYTPGPVRMQIIGELRDAASGTLAGRVIMFAGDARYGFNEMRLANRTTNAREMRIAFGQWSTLVFEALNVARNERPR